MNAEAGWYPQPDGQQRYWDGQKFTAPGTAAVENPAGNGGGKPVRESATETRRAPGMNTTHLKAKGFFASLFDFGFTSFITLRLLSVIYGMLVGLVLLASVIAAATILKDGTYPWFAIVVVPIVALIYLVLARVSMEMIALFFRIGENTNLMVASAGGAGLRSQSLDLTKA